MKKNSGENPVDRRPVRPEKSLYLARALYGARPRYFFRQTCRDEESGLLSSRQIFDLGDNPSRFIVPLGSHGYCVDDRVIDTIRPFVAGDAGEMAVPDGLQPYLIRYLILFFDYDFGASQALNDYIRRFINSHRTFGAPPKSPTVSMDAAGAIFGETKEKLAGLSKKELTKLYRRKAKELHPDIGGEHDEFVRLTEAFEELLRRR